MIILLILTWAYSKPIQLLAIIIQLLSYSWLFAINGLLHQASLSLTISWSLLKLWWCYPTISSSVLPFSSCLLSFPASRFFPVSQLFASCGQSIGASASASVLPMNDQDQLTLWLTELIFLQSKGLSRVFYSITVQKHQVFGAQPSLWSNSHIHTCLLEKP